MNGLELALLLLLAFVAPVILAIRLRNAESRRREPWRAIGQAFLWGATLGAFLSILLQRFAQIPVGNATLFLPALSIMIVVVVPVIEEAMKALGLALVHDRAPEAEDGYIYGGAVGLGFAATENVIFTLSALALGGDQSAVLTLVYRSIATVALHGAASGIAGHGVWWARYGGRPWAAVTGLASAIALHAAYNALATIAIGWATLAAAALAVVAYARMMRRVRVLDARHLG